jgi:hypothetical protein
LFTFSEQGVMQVDYQGFSINDLFILHLRNRHLTETYGYNAKTNRFTEKLAFPDDLRSSILGSCHIVFEQPQLVFKIGGYHSGNKSALKSVFIIKSLNFFLNNQSSIFIQENFVVSFF